MNKIIGNIVSCLAINQLSNRIYFMASKMQASSTQKTKDSAGRRLGYMVLYLE